MDDELLEAFNNWFYEMEGFHFVAERFYEELNVNDIEKREEVALEWLKTAFQKGYDIA